MSSLYTMLAEQSVDALHAIKTWLLLNEPMINHVVMGSFGSLLLFLGLIGMS